MRYPKTENVILVRVGLILIITFSSPQILLKLSCFQPEFTTIISPARQKDNIKTYNQFLSTASFNIIWNMIKY